MAAKVEKARRVRAERRYKIIGWTLVAVLVLGGLFALLAGLGAFGRDSQPTAGDVGSPSEATNASSTPSSSTSLDPALASRPESEPGSATITDLQVTTLVQGTGAPVLAGQSVTVNYVGVNYATGEEFDSTWTGPTESNPYTFTIGEGKLIDGWERGLQGVQVGSRVQLDVPADLAYGDDGSGDPAQGSLRFIIDVLDTSFPGVDALAP